MYHPPQDMPQLPVKGQQGSSPLTIREQPSEMDTRSSMAEGWVRDTPYIPRNKATHHCTKKFNNMCYFLSGACLILYFEEVNLNFENRLLAQSAYYCGCFLSRFFMVRAFFLRMELFLRMNNTRNCSREVTKYFSSGIFWWYWGAPQQRDRDGSFEIDFFMFATEFHMVKF